MLLHWPQLSASERGLWSMILSIPSPPLQGPWTWHHKNPGGTWECGGRSGAASRFRAHQDGLGGLWLWQALLRARVCILTCQKPGSSGHLAGNTCLFRGSDMPCYALHTLHPSLQVPRVSVALADTFPCKNIRLECWVGADGRDTADLDVQLWLLRILRAHDPDAVTTVVESISPADVAVSTSLQVGPYTISLQEIVRHSLARRHPAS